MTAWETTPLLDSGRVAEAECSVTHSGAEEIESLRGTAVGSKGTPSISGMSQGSRGDQQGSQSHQHSSGQRRATLIRESTSTGGGLTALQQLAAEVAEEHGTMLAEKQRKDEEAKSRVLRRMR